MHPIIPIEAPIHDAPTEDLDDTLAALARERLGIEARITGSERVQAGLAAKHQRARLPVERAAANEELTREIDRLETLKRRLAHIDEVIARTEANR